MPATAAGSGSPDGSGSWCTTRTSPTRPSFPTRCSISSKPEWKGRIGVAPSNASFQDFVTAMRFKLGDDATAQWLQGIADNDAFTFANNDAIVAAVGRGEIEVGLVNHYYVYQALAEDPEFAGDQPRLPGRRHRQPRDRHRRVDARGAPTARTKPSS